MALEHRGIVQKLTQIFSTTPYLKNFGHKKLSALHGYGSYNSSQVSGKFNTAANHGIAGSLSYNSVRFHSSQHNLKQPYSSVKNPFQDLNSTNLKRIRLFEYELMDEMAEIATSLDIMADESTQPNTEGNVIVVKSSNKKIKNEIENLFYDQLSLEQDSWAIIRDMDKNGDHFAEIVIDDELGVIGLVDIPLWAVQVLENTEENIAYNEDKLYQIETANEYFRPWQLAHFCLKGDRKYTPFGHSTLEGARKIWRQLNLIEDSVIIYRIVRAPQRRKFGVEVGTLPPKDVAQYLQQVKNSIGTHSLVDKLTGNIDKRFMVVDMTQDFWIPMRNGTPTATVDVMPGAKNISEIEDVQYFQNKLCAALQIPKAYLGFEGDLGGKSLLAQEDIKFARKIIRNQQCFIKELYKIAFIHLLIKGYTAEEASDIRIEMNNPSTIAQTLQLEYLNTKLDVASKMVDSGFYSKQYIQLSVLALSIEEIVLINRQRSYERAIEEAIEKGTYHSKFKKMPIELRKETEDDKSPWKYDKVDDLEKTINLIKPSTEVPNLTKVSKDKRPFDVTASTEMPSINPLGTQGIVSLFGSKNTTSVHLNKKLQVEKIKEGIENYNKKNKNIMFENYNDKK